MLIIQNKLWYKNFNYIVFISCYLAQILLMVDNTIYLNINYKQIYTNTFDIW